MNHISATIIAPIENREECRAFFGATLFNVELSESGAEPATHCVAAGPFDGKEIEHFVSDATFKLVFRLGEDVDRHILDAGLKRIEQAL